MLWGLGRRLRRSVATIGPKWFKLDLAMQLILTPFVLQLVERPGLAALNDMITGQAAFVGIIDQFEVMMIAMLIVSPLVLFLRKPRPAN
jgi:DHA2 family multidrug resistance protein